MTSSVLDEKAIRYLVSCPRCRAPVGEPCRGFKGNNSAPSRAVKPHPWRVQEAVRALRLAEPYSFERHEQDLRLLLEHDAQLPSSRYLEVRELADFVRNAYANPRHTAVKVSRLDLLAMVAEIMAHREKHPRP